MIARALEAEILRLHHAEGWPIGTIATQLRVHHSTVRRVFERAGVSPATPAVRAMLVDPYRAFILKSLAKYPRLRASRLYTMVRERGYRGAPDHFRTVVARLRPAPAAEAYLRLRTLPGEQGQVDWAHFGRLRYRARAASADGLRDGAQLLAHDAPALLSERGDGQLHTRPRRGV